MAVAKVRKKVPKQPQRIPGKRTPPKPVGPSRLTLFTQWLHHPRLRVDAYWFAIITLASAYLLLWFVAFPNVYGWLTDDHFCYLKSVVTVADWKQAFIFYYNALQTYFFLISYLPIKLGLTVKSFELPVFGAQTGQFRFLLLYSVLLHGLILVEWGWVARLLTQRRRLIVLGLILWLSSPTLYFYAPDPNSRLLGMPFALLGLYCLLRARASRRPLLMFFLAGLLFGTGQNIHYTTLYMIAPISLAFWAVYVWRHRRERSWIGQMLCFGAGCIVVAGLLEWISYAGVHIPVQQGPLATMKVLADMHISRWTRLHNLEVWGSIIVSQLGIPVFCFAAVGVWIFYKEAKALPDGVASQALPVALAVPLGFLYLISSRSMPFFRQISVLEPFLWLLAATGIYFLASRLPLRGRLEWKVALLALIAMATPAMNAYAVFNAHQSLGRALAWVDKNKKGRPVYTLPVFWYPDNSSLREIGDIRLASSDGLLLTYFPFTLVQSNPSLRSYLEDEKPIISWKSLWDTETGRAQTESFYFDQNFPAEPELSDVRIYDIGQLQKRMQGEPLGVTSVNADSMLSNLHQPVNVFDHDSGLKGVSAWVSANTAGPHTIEFELDHAVPLGSLRVTSPSLYLPLKPEQYFGRVSAIEVEGQAPGGAWTKLWSGNHLSQNQVVRAEWPKRTLKKIRCKVLAQTRLAQEVSQAAIEEIQLPGYDLRVPAIVDEEGSGPLPASAQIANSQVTVIGSNFTNRTVINMQDVSLPTRFINANMLRGRLLRSVPYIPGQSSLYLTDGLRRSKAIDVPAPLVITAVETDSDFGGGYEKSKLFDNGESTDHITSWESGDFPMPHYVLLKVSGSPKLGEIYIVNRPVTQIDELDVQIQRSGKWTTVYRGRGIRNISTIRAKWAPTPIDAIKIVVYKEYYLNRDRIDADIEELLFPGFWPSCPVKVCPVTH